MRRGWAAFAVILLLMQGVPAQEQAESIQVLNDSGGDVSMDIAGNPGNSPAGAFDYLDLRGAEIQEDEGGFVFRLELASMQGPAGEPLQTSGYYVYYFTHEDTEFRIVFSRCFFCGTTFIDGRLQAKATEADEWSDLARSNNFEDIVVEPNGFSWWIPRDLLADQKGAAPYPGRTLTSMWAESGMSSNGFAMPDMQGGTLFDFPVQVHDRMPDTGVSSEVVDVMFGITQLGDARLSSEEPFRASNGEATTFIYTIHARNVGESEHIFQFDAVGAPDRWTVSFPIPTLVLGPGESVDIPVLVNTPFAHQHGGAESFVVEMTAPQDAGHVGRVEVGVRYLEIPQPAGHHDTVWLHSREYEADNEFEQVFLTAFANGAGELWFNAEQDDPLDQRVPILADQAGSRFQDGAMESDFFWLIPLNPGLRLGLDGDLAGTGSLSIPIEVPLTLPSATVSAELSLVGPDLFQPGRGPGGGRCGGPNDTVEWQFPYGCREVTPLVKVVWDNMEFGTGERTVLESDFSLLPKGDYVEYDPANNLVLYIHINAIRPQTFISSADRPSITNGGSMTLPLFEYEDPVDEAFAAATGPLLEVLADPARTANPGGVHIFHVHATDQGAAAGEYELSLTGQNTAWVQFLGHERISLPDGETVSIPLAVVVPADAEPGERADFFLQAVARDDPSARGLVRIVVDVDDSRAWDDDSAEFLEMTGALQESPGLPLLVLLAGIFVALRRRR